MEDLLFKLVPNVRQTVKTTGLSHPTEDVRHAVRESLHLAFRETWQELSASSRRKQMTAVQTWSFHLGTWWERRKGQMHLTPVWGVWWLSMPSVLLVSDLLQGCGVGSPVSKGGAGCFIRCPVKCTSLDHMWCASQPCCCAHRHSNLWACMWISMYAYCSTLLSGATSSLPLCMPN